MAKKKSDTRWRVREGKISVTEESAADVLIAKLHALQEKEVNDIRGTLAQRGAVHGDYTLDATFAIRLADTLDDAPSWPNLDPVKRHALTMIVFKIARILHGSPDHRDHWHDIAGYATLAEDRCG